MCGRREYDGDGLTNRSTNLAHGRCQTNKVSPQWSGEGLGCAQECGHTRSHLAHSVEDPVKHYKQWEHSFPGCERASDDEAHYTEAGEA